MSVKILFILTIVAIFDLPAFAVGSDPVSPILLAVAVILTAAKLCGWLARRLGQPAVLGELVAGLLIGNLNLIGFDSFAYFATDSSIDILARIGVILLLFEVGLESSVKELKRVGLSATIVAVVGVVAPMALGFGICEWLIPDKSWLVHLFIGATLCATSVGITARVLKDINRLKTNEASIILGAAVIDDVLGIMVLAVVAGIISYSAAEANVSILGTVGWISIKAFVFLGVSLLLGQRIANVWFTWVTRLKLKGAAVTAALCFCFFWSYLADVIGLAAIIGAFAAGLVLDASGIDRLFAEDNEKIEESLFPLSRLFVPIFFVVMGTRVQLATFVGAEILLFGLSLTAVAVAGKLICGMVAFSEQPISKLSIGIGMIPRGEVGLVFASLGTQLFIDGEPVISGNLYSQVILMVVITTMMTPPLLKWSFRGKG